MYELPSTCSGRQSSTATILQPHSQHGFLLCCTSVQCPTITNCESYSTADCKCTKCKQYFTLAANPATILAASPAWCAAAGQLQQLIWLVAGWNVLLAACRGLYYVRLVLLLETSRLTAPAACSAPLAKP